VTLAYNKHNQPYYTRKKMKLVLIYFTNITEYRAKIILIYIFMLLQWVNRNV